MRIPSSTNSLAASAIILAALAGCGGGDDAPAAALTPTPGADPVAPGPGVQAPVASLVISGTAATGMAFARASVDVKCAAGNGSTTTAPDGSYSVSIPGGALPCMVKVAGNASGQAVTLHSLADAGTTSGFTTTATANLTPLTELALAQLTGTIPSAVFDNFSGAPVRAAQLGTATGVVFDALKEATGVDLGTLDPFKGQLLARTATSETQNDYDRLLDALGSKLSVASLPLVVNQMTIDAGVNGAPALSQSLSIAQGCPFALSGPYRSVNLVGEVKQAAFDFKAMKATFAGATTSSAIYQNPEQACDFSVDGMAFDAAANYRFAIGPAGAGALRTLSGTDTLTGYLFPAQSPGAAALVGDWTIAQSGVRFNQTTPQVARLGQFTAAAGGAYLFCYYDGADCFTQPSNSPYVASAVDGGYELRQASRDGGTFMAAKMYLYRSPDGSTTIYGTSNPEDTSAIHTHFMGGKLHTLALPEVGATTKALEFTAQPGAAGGTSVQAGIPAAARYTVQSVDAAARTLVRQKDFGISQSLFVDVPLPGLLTAPSDASVIMAPPGLGLSVTWLPAGPGFLHTISVPLQ